MASSITADIKATIRKMKPNKFLQLSHLLMPSVVAMAMSRRKQIRNLGLDFLFMMMWYCWKTSKSLQRFSKVAASLAHRIVTREHQPPSRSMKGRVILKEEAPDIYMHQQALTNLVKKELNRRIKNGKVKDAKFVESCDVYFVNMHKLFKHMYIVQAYQRTAPNEHIVVDSLIAIVRMFKDITGGSKLFEIYTNRLAEIHDTYNNTLEHGNSLLVHAGNLKWEDRYLDGISSLPAESAIARKHRLLRKAKQVFSDSKIFGKCADISSTLTFAYRTQLYDIPALCQELRLQAQYFNNVIESDTFYPKYYLVSYSHHGFEEDVSGRTFIYRSSKNNREFCAEIQEMHPDTKVTKDHEMPKKRIQHCIGVTTLTCSSLKKSEGLVSHWDITELDERYKRYLMNTNVEAFSYSRTYKGNSPEVIQIRNEQRDNSPGMHTPNERHEVNVAAEETGHENLWVIETFVIPEEALPCARRRVPVVAKKTRLLTPLKAAVITISAKNDIISETARLLERNSSGGMGIVNRLSQQLSGTIDAAVNGGVKEYIKAFLQSDYIDMHPQDEKTLVEFRIALKNQMQLLEKGLSVFGENCGEKLRPLHSHLVQSHQQVSMQIRKSIEKFLIQRKAKKSTSQVRPNSPSV